MGDDATSAEVGARGCCWWRSLAALGVFVYGFLGWNVRVSFTSWRGLTPKYDNVGLRNYVTLGDDERFNLDVMHVLVFTLVFVLGSPLLLACVPTVAVYIILGRFFMRGPMAGALKG